MRVEVPSWFKYRQGKAEPAGDNLLKLTGPNLVEGYVGIRPAENGGWHAFVRAQADGPDLDATRSPLETQLDAWYAAFELFRTHMIV
jgi:hypothetical protein